MGLKRVISFVLAISQVYASSLFDEFTPKFANKRNSEARIGLLEEIDAHTIELANILKQPDFLAFRDIIKHSEYSRLPAFRLNNLRTEIAKTAHELFVTNWAQSGNVNYPPDKALAMLRAIKTDLLKLEQQLPRLPHGSLSFAVNSTPLNCPGSIPEKMAYIRDLQNTAHDILFRLLYKFKLVQKIVLKFSGDLSPQVMQQSVKRKVPEQEFEANPPLKKRFNMIPHDQLPVPTQ